MQGTVSGVLEHLKLARKWPFAARAGEKSAAPATRNATTTKRAERKANEDRRRIEGARDSGYGGQHLRSNRRGYERDTRSARREWQMDLDVSVSCLLILKSSELDWGGG